MRATTLIGYLICLAGVAVAEIVARRHPERLVPIGELLRQVTAHRPVRITLLVFWWWLGWHFLMDT